MAYKGISAGHFAPIHEISQEKALFNDNGIKYGKVSQRNSEMTITKETRANMAEVLGQATVSEKTAQDILLICKNDLTARQALMLRGIDNPCPDTVTDLKRKSEKFLLSSPEMQELAGSAAKRILQGKPIIGKVKVKGEEHINVINPKGSDVTSVIDMVTKRTEPIKQDKGSAGINLFIDKVQVNQFQTQDVVPELDSDNGSVIDVNEINGLCDE
jgi:hypothetical protein